MGDVVESEGEWLEVVRWVLAASGGGEEVSGVVVEVDWSVGLPRGAENSRVVASQESRGGFSWTVATDDTGPPRRNNSLNIKGELFQYPLCVCSARVCVCV